MTDNVATLEGYSRLVVAIGGPYELYLFVKPDTDLNDRFRAWDSDNQEFLMINGWMFAFEDESASA